MSALVSPQGRAFLPGVLLTALAGPPPQMLHPSAPGLDSGHQRMRKVLPLTPLHSSTCPPPHLPANGEPSKTMSQPHTISQWQPTQPLRLHRGRGQKPGGPQGAQLEGRRGECLHIVYTPHTWSQPSESRLECSFLPPSLTSSFPLFKRALY